MDETLNPPHVLIFPLPIQGHVNSMLNLAELLSLAGLQVTFLNSDHNHRRLILHSSIDSRFANYPGFRFQTISDGLSDDHPRTGNRFVDMFDSLNTVARPLFRELLLSGRLSSGERPPFTCIIADGIFEFAMDIANEVGIPLFLFRTIGASCFWAYYCIHDLIQAGELPFQGDDLDQPIKSLPGMEGFLRQRDLPSFLRIEDTNSPVIHLLNNQTRRSTKAQALIFNTFEELEGPILSLIRTKCPKVYTIGPVHAHLKAKLAEQNISFKPSSSLWEEDWSCMAWLESQPSKSVIYVSFGSLTEFGEKELMEFWYGLVNSNIRFLWVVRPDSIVDKDGERKIPTELLEGTKARGYMVEWAPQQEVLGHAAIGGFLTHSGWNSTMESLVARIPMICWPYFADQQFNSRLVSEGWGIGLDMKDTCDRATVEMLVRVLMVERREELERWVDNVAQMASRSVSKGGSSYSNLDSLIEHIKSSSISVVRG